MSKAWNEKGVTLIEVLTSITILSIIIIPLLNFFPQMGLMNKENEEKIQAVNLAKQIMVMWKESEDVQNYIKSYSNNSSIVLPQDEVTYADMRKDSGSLIFMTTQGDFEIEIKISLSSDLDPVKYSSRAYIIHVQVLNQRGNLASESFGYVISS